MVVTMAKRKPLPYAAASLVDAALMENTSAVRALMPIVNGQELSREEFYRLLAKAIHHLHQSTESLREARMTNRNGG